LEEENKSVENIEKSIRNKLKKLGYIYDDLDKKKQNYLVKIEECILKVYKRENEAKKLITNNNVSIKNMSENANIARQTFYNVPILSEYVNYNSKEFDKIGISLKLSSSSEEIQELKADIELMQKRDIEIEKLKKDIEELKQELKTKDYTISAFRKRI